MSRRRRHSVIGVAIAAGSALCAFFLSNVSFFQTVNLKAQDAHFVFRGSRPVRNIVLLTIDKSSLETFPEVQLFWHPYYAEAIKASARAGAKVLVLDVAFGIPVNKWEPDHDQMLAEAVVTAAPAMPVICAYVAPMMGKQQDWPVPLNMLASAMGLADPQPIASCLGAGARSRIPALQSRRVLRWVLPESISIAAAGGARYHSG